jgi:hypothetical protein
MDYLSIKNNDLCFLKSNKQNICCFCEDSYKSTYSLVKKNITYQVCDLCRCVIYYNKEIIYKFIILQSDLSQKNIINKTVEFYHREGCVPSPNYIDKNVKSIDVSTQQLAYLMSDDYKFKKNMFEKGIRYFFTPDYNFDKILIRNVFSSKVTVNDFFWKDIKKLDTYELKQDIENTLNVKYVGEVLTKSEMKLKNKINYVISLFKILERINIKK